MALLLGAARVLRSKGGGACKEMMFVLRVCLVISSGIVLVIVLIIPVVMSLVRQQAAMLVSRIA